MDAKTISEQPPFYKKKEDPKPRPRDEQSLGLVKEKSTLEKAILPLFEGTIAPYVSVVDLNNRLPIDRQNGNSTKPAVEIGIRISF